MGYSDRLFCQYNSDFSFCDVRFQAKPLNFTTAGDWDCVAAVERLPVLHYGVDFIFLSFWIMGFIVEI